MSIPEGFSIHPIRYPGASGVDMWCAELIRLSSGEVVGFADCCASPEQAVEDAIGSWKRAENSKFRRDVPTAGEW